MTQVDFYVGSSNKHHLACQLAAKAFSQKLPVVIYTNDSSEASTVDKMLWTIPAIAFIPHCQSNHELAAETPIIIAHTPQKFRSSEVLINLQPESPIFFDEFGRLIEIVTEDEEDKSNARIRWKYYKDRGCTLRNFDVTRKKE
jgi:DNA polymerase-3 subunit chi